MITGSVKLRIGVAAALALAVGFTTGYTSAVSAQSKGGGSIVCWKDAAGKVVGCGDKVPPEYATGGTKVLDKGGNVRKTGDSAEEAAKRREQEGEQAKIKAEEQKRLAEQKRQDSALLNTFTNADEIDLKRKREIQAIDNNITQQQAALKVANDRLADAKGRAAASDKDKKAAPQPVKEDLARAERDKTRLEQDIAAKEQDKRDIETKYAAYKKRYLELKGVTPTTPAAATPATPAATTPAPAAAKK